MTLLSFRGWLACLFGTALVVGCAGTRQKAAKLSTKEAFFVENVKPVLERNCLRCHNGTTLPGKLNLTDASTALTGKKGGMPYIVPGQPDDSRLILAISRKGTHRLMMPQLPISLTDDQIGTLREWIEDGAVWPTGEAGHLKTASNPENP